MQKSAIILRKNLKINMQKIKQIVKLEVIAIIQENIDKLRIAYAI